MDRRAVLGAVAAVALVVGVIGVAWTQGWIGRPSPPAPPAVSPVTVSFGPSVHLEGHWVAYVEDVSATEPYGDYTVSLLEVPTGDWIVTNSTVRPFYIAGNGDVSLFYDDNDGDGSMSAGDDLYLGSFGTGPYDVILFWRANGATVTTFRCS